MFLRVDFSSTEFFFKVLLHDGVFFGDPFVVNFSGPLVVLIGLRGALWLSKFFVELSGVFVTVVEVDVSAVDGDGFSQSEVVSGEELSVLSEAFLSAEEGFAHGETVVLLFLFVHLDGVVFQVKEDFYFSVALIL